MKQYLKPFVLLLLLAATAQAEILHLKIPSKALVDSTRIIVATPATFNPQKPGGYPYILMLHGWAGDETQWEKDSELQSLADTYQTLLVLPDGGYDAWWLDTRLIPGRNYNTHIHDELQAWITDRFNASPKSSQHGVLGLSMGGYGAVMQAFLYPSDYAAVCALSGVMDLIPRTERWGLKLTLGEYPGNETWWRKHNPLDLALQVDAELTPPILLICGVDDKLVIDGNRSIYATLRDRGFDVTLREEPGTHSHTFWKTHVESAVAFIVSHFESF